jgi:putative ABC transport system permease protein
MIDYGSWRHPETGREGDQAVFGVRPHANPFILPGILGREDILSLPDGALYDERSNPSYGDIAEIMNRDEVIHGEINGRRVRILGTFELGETLAVFGHIVVGVDAFRRLLQRTDNGIELGMIELRPGANALEAAGRLNALLPGDVEVITRQELILREKTYWEEHTPLGFIVISGMIIAMFVGAVIVYQILYTDINDHVREYATLKAMGLGDGFFLRLVLQEAAILTALGFIPGLLFTWVLFYLAETEGGLPTRLTIPDTLLVFGLTVVTCVIAGLLATRRLRAADPADIF